MSSTKRKLRIDKKFNILAVNPINGRVYTDEDSLILCAKDRAVPVALEAYQAECRRIGCKDDHVLSVGLLIERVRAYQLEVEASRPDTEGDELIRCLEPNE